MQRRQFLGLAAVAAGGWALATWRHDIAAAPAAKPTDVAAFRAARRYVELRQGRIAYVERGSGRAALFLHGLPLNGYQWRGAIDRLSAHRRCIAPDLMGLGYSEVPAQQALGAGDQAAMIAALLDKLGIADVDLVASDSGGAVAQLFTAHHPRRVRSLLLTNCDVEPDSPPPKVKPIIEQARAGTLADSIAKWVTDKTLARSIMGTAVFHDPAAFADDTIDYYIAPLVSSPLRRKQFEAYHIALEPNPLAGIEATLKRCTQPVRVVWGTDDDIFAQSDADYLARVFPNSQGVRRLPGAKLFFPEEFPDVVAEEARALWRIRA
jgi:pimeloyl-ACP methyl ester carboxylesterase